MLMLVHILEHLHVCSVPLQDMMELPDAPSTCGNALPAGDEQLTCTSLRNPDCSPGMVQRPSERSVANQQE